MGGRLEAKNESRMVGKTRQSRSKARDQMAMDKRPRRPRGPGNRRQSRAERSPRRAKSISEMLDEVGAEYRSAGNLMDAKRLQKYANSKSNPQMNKWTDQYFQVLFLCFFVLLCGYSDYLRASGAGRAGFGRIRCRRAIRSIRSILQKTRRAVLRSGRTTRSFIRRTAALPGSRKASPMDVHSFGCFRQRRKECGDRRRTREPSLSPTTAGNEWKPVPIGMRKIIFTA